MSMACWRPLEDMSLMLERPSPAAADSLGMKDLMIIMCYRVAKLYTTNPFSIFNYVNNNFLIWFLEFSILNFSVP